MKRRAHSNGQMGVGVDLTRPELVEDARHPALATDEVVRRRTRCRTVEQGGSSYVAFRALDHHATPAAAAA
ncbi:unnamed protein product, partial [marine sediment metagenome]